MFKKIVSLFMFSVFLLSVSALALDYSAESIDVKMIGKEKEVTKGKAYVTKNKWRAEAEDEEGEKSITIFRYDKEVLWILIPAEKKYMEQKLSMEQIIAAATELGKELEKKEYDLKVWKKIVGSEKVSGILCDKYKITTKYTYDKKTYTNTMYQWISRRYKELGMKTVFEDGSYSYLKNVKIGKQPAYLFEIPKGYEKMKMGGFMIMEEREEVEEEEEEGYGVEEELKDEIQEQFKPEIPIQLPF